MEKSELIKRTEDLASRCDKTCCVTHTKFLTPAERFEIQRDYRHNSDCGMLFSGGGTDCERTVLFFLPFYLTEDDFSPSETIRAIQIKAYFGTPGHRDYLGALLGMGIEREWLGDIRIFDDTAYAFCMDSVAEHLLTLEKVGRCGVKTCEISCTAVPAAVKNSREITFTVMSMRLDAVLAGMYNLSRTEASRLIAAGSVSVNYSVTEKQDFPVRENDIISVRGIGKGLVTGIGGTSRRGRMFVNAEIYK